MDRKQSKRSRDYDSDSDSSDPEMDAEMKAVVAIHKERTSKSAAPQTNNNNYNRDALTQNVEEMGTLALPFEESYQICEFPIELENDLDDLDRETKFYQHTVAAVISGRKKLEQAGIPFRRPTDYFCEHVKTDLHMARIKDRLLLEQKKIEIFEQRKDRDNQRKFHQQVNQEVKKKKSEEQDKNDRKSKKNDEKTDKNVDEKDSKRKFDAKDDGKSLKRQRMDRKYRLSSGKDKRNDSKSLNDFKEFSPHGGKLNKRSSFKGGKGFKPKTNVKTNVKGKRPGKSARDQKRSFNNRK